MSATVLTVKGDVEVLLLQPGDVLTVTPEHRLTREQVEELKASAEQQFPGRRVVVLNGVRLGVMREQAA